MLLFEQNNICKVAELKVQCKRRYLFSYSVSLMPTKTAHRDYIELLPGSVTSRTQINPAPGNMQQRGARSCCTAEKTRGAHKNLFIYESRFCLLTIHKFQNQCSKADVLNPVPPVLLLCISLAFRSSAQWIHVLKNNRSSTIYKKQLI